LIFLLIFALFASLKNRKFIIWSGHHKIRCGQYFSKTIAGLSYAQR
jgi:hypothetical protein